jgi:predicted NodU family carbamoyl transferase
MTVILGFNAFHADSAACLVVDGQLVGAVAEERLGERQKHSPAFPANAIRRLLADAGLRLRDVTHVALARDPGANRAAKMAYVAALDWCDDVVVLDSFSTDETVSVAERLGARVYQRRFDHFAGQRNHALNVSDRAQDPRAQARAGAGSRLNISTSSW